MSTRTAAVMVSLLSLVHPSAADAFSRRPDGDKYFWNYEVVARFVAEGQEFTARGVFGCFGKITGDVFLSGTGRKLNYRTHIHWLGKRLPSGAAVLFRSPAGICKPPTIKRRPLPSWFFPPVFWIDNADNPRVMEAYVSRVYYEHPKPRVRLLSFEINYPMEARPTDPRKEIGWLGSGPDAAPFYGYSARVVTEAEWRQAPEVAAILQRFRKPGWVTHEQHMAILGSFYSAPARAIQTGFQYWSLPGPGVPSARPKSLAANRGTYPIRRLSVGYVLDRRRPGLVVYYRRKIKSTGELFPLTLRLNGGQPVVCQLRFWCFDPKTKLMISISYEGVGVYHTEFQRFDKAMRRRYGQGR